MAIVDKIIGAGLINRIEDDKGYTKQTLLQCLSEAHSNHTYVPSNYKTILSRERAELGPYNKVHRDPTNNTRIYTGALIKEIVEYEINKR